MLSGKDWFKYFCKRNLFIETIKSSFFYVVFKLHWIVTISEINLKVKNEIFQIF